MNKLKTKRGRPKKAPKITIQSNYLSVPEVASLLKMSTSHIYTMTSKKQIPYIKLSNKKVIFDKTQINDWLRDKTVQVK